MDPQTLSINDFDYSLPNHRIATHPLPERDASKLLIYSKGVITEDIYRHIDQHLPPHSLLIFNNTKVVEARILFKKPSGGVIEIFCLEPHEQYPDITTAMLQKEKVLWHCLIGGASKWKPGQTLQKKITDSNLVLEAKYLEKRIDSFIVQLSWNNSQLSFAEVLHLAGATPLPPYIKREADKEDNIRYQTVYARHDGSVAAPTAGLHFTNTIFEKLEKKNIRKDFVTLHVGAGTFKPVKTDTMKDHEMHAEFIDVPLATIENIWGSLAIARDDSSKIIAVGTTSLRTIESLYWLGVKLKTQPGKDLPLTQWEPYELDGKNISPGDSLKTIIGWMKEKNLERLLTKTQIIIAPGYQLKIANGLITNFHQPRSTLLLLVAALIGDEWKKVYNYALENNFRFLSYGDGMLIYPNP